MGKLDAEKTHIRRHGDVLILTKKGFKIPADVKLNKADLLHQGMNNKHVFKKGECLIGEKEDKKYIRVKKDGIVSHVGGSSTHKDKPLKKGEYWVEIQTFYDHFKEESRRVID